MCNIKLLDGSIEVIADVKDFSELIDRKLGFDARRWFDGYSEALEDRIAYLEDFTDCSQCEYVQ